MTPAQMLNRAVHALTLAHDLAEKGAESAEVSPEKTDQKVQRLAFVADEWMKLAALTAEIDRPQPAWSEPLVSESEPPMVTSV